MKNFDNIRDDIMNSIENRVRQAYNKGYVDGQKDILEQSICKVTDAQKAYKEGYADYKENTKKELKEGYENGYIDGEWKPNQNDKLHKLRPAIDALDEMLGTLQLDGLSKDAIKELVIKYTLFVVDLANYGVVAYSNTFRTVKETH